MALHCSAQPPAPSTFASGPALQTASRQRCLQQHCLRHYTGHLTDSSESKSCPEAYCCSSLQMSVEAWSASQLRSTAHNGSSSRARVCCPSDCRCLYRSGTGTSSLSLMHLDLSTVVMRHSEQRPPPSLQMDCRSWQRVDGRLSHACRSSSLRHHGRLFLRPGVAGSWPCAPLGSATAWA